MNRRDFFKKTLLLPVVVLTPSLLFAKNNRDGVLPPLNWKTNEQIQRDKYRNEFEKCKNDIVYFIENYCSVNDVGTINLSDQHKLYLNNFIDGENLPYVSARSTGKTLMSVLFTLHNTTFFDDKKTLLVYNSYNEAIRSSRILDIITDNLPNFLKDYFHKNDRNIDTITNNHYLRDGIMGRRFDNIIVERNQHETQDHIKNIYLLCQNKHDNKTKLSVIYNVG